MNLYTRAQRFIGIRELSGDKNHPLIVWWLSLCDLKEQPDETPWCSAFMNGMAWDCEKPRTRSAAARSWLELGRVKTLEEAEAVDDVVILKTTAEGPGADVTRGAPGHVGLFARIEGERVWLLGGNQDDEVRLSSFPRARVIGIRRIE